VQQQHLLMAMSSHENYRHRCGARPQFIKATVVSWVPRKFNKEMFFHTGQRHE
jgi:hypothetical protein